MRQALPALVFVAMVVVAFGQRPAHPVAALESGPKATLEVMALTATPMAGTATATARQLGLCREWAAKAAGVRP